MKGQSINDPYRNHVVVDPNTDLGARVSWTDWLEVAERYREQGLFQDVQDALGRYVDDSRL